MIYAEHILICIAVPLLIALVFIRSNAQRFAAALLAGMGVCLLAAYISSFINALTDFGEIPTAVYISPVVEELMKLLPLLLFLNILPPEDGPLLLAAAGIGTGFAIFENCCFLASPEMSSFAFVAVRGFAVGVMHVVSALALALGLVLVRRFRALQLPGVLGALSLSMTFHGLYNLLVAHPGAPAVVGYILPLLTTAVLYPFWKRIK